MGEFEDLIEIASGAYGKLYKARQPKLDRDVALKVVDVSIEGAPDALAHARAMAKVEHENIVKIYAIEQFDLLGDGVVHDVIVMQWLPGETLEDRLAGDRFSSEDAIAVCRGVLNGLIALHNGNVAHGDLHCRNIMLVNSNHPVIIDVHPTEQAFLSQQPLTTREAKVSQDIGFCRSVIVRTLRHSTASAVTTANFDTRLVDAATLEEITKVVDSYLDAGSELGATLVTLLSSIGDQVIDYIENDKEASLTKLISTTSKSICHKLLSDQFACDNRPDEENVRQRVEIYESLTMPMMEIAAASGSWTEGKFFKPLGNSIESLTNVYEELGIARRAGGYKAFTNLRLYPPALTFYSAAFSAWVSGRFPFLHYLLNELTYVENQNQRSLAQELLYWVAESREDWNSYVLNGKRDFTPVSDRLVQMVSEVVAPNTTMLPLQLESEFDQFEFFLGLVNASSGQSSDQYYEVSWAPVGRFIWRTNTLRRQEPSPGQKMLNELRDGKQFEFLKAGFFQNDPKVLKNSLLMYERYCNQAKSSFGVRF